MPQNDVQSHCRTGAVAEDIGAAEAQLIDCGRNVIGQGFEGQWTINVGGSTVTLKLKGHDLSALRKAGQQLFERGADRRERAVQQHQRLSLAMDLVVHLKIVHRNVAGLYGNLANSHEPIILASSSEGAWPWLHIPRAVPRVPRKPADLV